MTGWGGVVKSENTLSRGSRGSKKMGGGGRFKKGSEESAGLRVHSQRRGGPGRTLGPKKGGNLWKWPIEWGGRSGPIQSGGPDF